MVLIAAAAASLAGCALKTSPTLTDRFVRQGAPATDLGGTPQRVYKTRSAQPATEHRIAQVSRYYPTDADLDKHDPGVREALSAVALAPTLAHYLDAAQAYRSLGVLDRAYDHLQHAVAIDPQNAAANDGLARLWRDWGLPQLGLANAHRAMYAAPRSATARHTLGTLLYALGLRPAAEKAFRDATALDGHAWYAWQNLCTIAMADGRTKEAIQLCQRADAERCGAETGTPMIPAATPSEFPSERELIGNPQAEPQTLEETGLSADLMTQLILKTLHFSGAVTGSGLAAKLGLSHSAIEPILSQLKLTHLCQVIASGALGGPSFVYRITDAGRNRALLFLEQNHYVGVAPVPFVQYRAVHEEVRGDDAEDGDARARSPGLPAPRAQRPRARPARAGHQRRALAVRLRPSRQRQDGHRSGHPEHPRRHHRHPARRSRPTGRSSRCSIRSRTSRLKPSPRPAEWTLAKDWIDAGSSASGRC